MKIIEKFGYPFFNCSVVKFGDSTKFEPFNITHFSKTSSFNTNGCYNAIFGAILHYTLIVCFTI